MIVYGGYVRPYSFRFVRNGLTYWSHERPKDVPYTVEVYDLKAYEQACRAGDFYGGVGHVLVDNRKSVG